MTVARNCAAPAALVRLRDGIQGTDRRISPEEELGARNARTRGTTYSRCTSYQAIHRTMRSSR